MKRFFLTLALPFALPLVGHGAVKLAGIFSDHAVLQRSGRTPVWGHAAAGEKVHVTLDKAQGDAVAGVDGKWQVNLDLSQSAPGPFDLVVQGTNPVTVKDVLVGEVWLCSGQSNMELRVSSTMGAKEEIAASANPQLRQFLVKRHAQGSPPADYAGTWMVAGPETTGQFTAAGYYFGKTVQQALGRPVGLINNSWGGTPIEAWLSQADFDATPALQPGEKRDLDDANSFAQRQKIFVDDFKTWAEQNNRTDHPADPAAFAGPAVDETGWTPVTLPSTFAAAQLPTSGAVWFRKKVSSPRLALSGMGELRLGELGQFDSVYWNGTLVGATSPEQEGSADGRLYKIPANLIQPGDNVLAIRIYSPWDAGSVNATRQPFQAGDLSLAGPWLAKVEYSLPVLAPDAAASHPQPPKKPKIESNLPTYLYNGMVLPLAPYQLAGILWYQGEHNAPEAFLYRTEFPLLINRWRDLLGADLPFYFCQLPNFMAKKSVPEESAWAEQRESQAKALAVSGTGMAVLIDVGEEGSIHPRNKKTPGERLAAMALAKTYGEKVPFSGPTYQSMKVEGDKIRIEFQPDAGQLVASPLPATYEKNSLFPSSTALVRNSPQSELEGFAICGADKVWKWADAKIDNGAVLVWSAQVPMPVAVRYAWASNPTCNLYNADGFPAAPFRTDDFPLTTEGKAY